MTSSRMILVAPAVVAIMAVACGTDPEAAKRVHFTRGNEYAESGKHREAIIEYRKAIQEDARFGEARFKLAQSYDKVENKANAYREYIRAADLLPDRMDAQLKAAEVLLGAGRFRDAEVRVGTVLTKDPQNVEAIILKANVLAGLGEGGAAVASLQEAIRLAPNRTATYANLGAIRMVRGDMRQAQDAFELAVERNPDSVDARLALANFYWRAANRTSDAEAQYKRLLQQRPQDSEVNRAVATFYLATGKATEAEGYLKVAAATGATRETVLALADYYTGLQRLPEAKAAYQDLAKRYPESATTAKIRLAVLGLSSGEGEVPLTLLDEVLIKEPTNVDALVVKSRLLLTNRRVDDALAASRAAVQAAPDSAFAHTSLGEALVGQGDNDAAFREFQEALTLKPQHAPALVNLARLHLLRRNLSEAEQFARSAVRATPGNPNTLLLLARILLIGGDSATAERILTGLKTSFPDSAAVQTEIGLLQLMRKNTTAARDALERALAIDPGIPDAVAALAKLEFDEKKPEAAQRRVRAALDRYPDEPKLLRIAGRIQLAANDADGAQSSLRRAIEVEPSNIESYTMLAQLYASRSELDKALAEFQSLLKVQPRSVAANTAVGVLYELMNKRDEAKKAYERTLEINSTAPVAANNLAWLTAESGGNLDLALQLAQTAKAQLPDSPEINDTLGWVYYKKGLSTLALPPLRLAAEKSPDEALYHYHLGLAYAGAGDAGNARRSLQKALSIAPVFSGSDHAKTVLVQLKNS